MYDDEEMIPLNFGEMPSREVWNNRVPEEPYPMVIRSQDLWSSPGCGNQPGYRLSS